MPRLSFDHQMDAILWALSSGPPNLFGGNRLVGRNIGNHAIGIATSACRLMRADFGPHVTGTFAALGRASVKTEDLGRTIGTAILDSLLYIPIIERVTNTNIHGANATCYQLRPALIMLLRMSCK